MLPYLRKAKFIGDFGLNCIVNESGIYILEATSRFGSPIVHLQSEIHSSPWGEFLYALACGKSYDLKWKKGYGLVVVLATPPFPYQKKSKDIHYYGLNVYLKDMTKEELSHIHWEEVSLRTFEQEQFYITDNRGYIAYATSVAETIEEAQKKVYTIARKVIVPKIMFRNDIGESFRNGDRERLGTWGFL
jgi:phosphoribosylamine--glycine ligase